MTTASTEAAQQAATGPTDAPVEPAGPDTANNTADPAEAATDTPTGDTDGTDTAALDKAGRDAPRYRQRLREAEAERDQLRAQLDAMRRQAVDQQATAAGILPAALWAAGTNLDDLLDDAGAIDAAAVDAAVQAARDLLGIRPLPKAPSALGQGTSAGGDVHTRGNGEGRMVDALRPH